MEDEIRQSFAAVRHLGGASHFCFGLSDACAGVVRFPPLFHARLAARERSQSFGSVAAVEPGILTVQSPFSAPWVLMPEGRKGSRGW